MWRRGCYCQENRITSYKSVEIGAFRILQRASTYISFSPVKLLYLDTLRSFNHSIC